MEMATYCYLKIYIYLFGVHFMTREKSLSFGTGRSLPTYLQEPGNTDRLTLSQINENVKFLFNTRLLFLTDLLKI